MLPDSSTLAGVRIRNETPCCKGYYYGHVL